MPSDNRIQELFTDVGYVHVETQIIQDDFDEHRVTVMGDINVTSIKKVNSGYNDLYLYDLSFHLVNFTYLDTIHKSISWIDHVNPSKNGIFSNSCPVPVVLA